MTYLTTEQARQIEEVLSGMLHGTDWNNGTHAKIYRPKFPEALSIIRAAREQEQAEQKPVENNDWKKVSYIRETLNSEQAEQEPFMCEPVPPIDDDGWTDWVCPKPQGYLMQCCDCGLIHEVDSRVAKYQPMPSEEFEVVDDPDVQCQWRVRRRDDLAAKEEQAEQRSDSERMEPDIFYRCNGCGCAYEFEPPSSCDCMDKTGFTRIEYYAAPVRTKEPCNPLQDLTDEEIMQTHTNFDFDSLGEQSFILAFARAVIAADRELNRA